MDRVASFRCCWLLVVLTEDGVISVEMNRESFSETCEIGIQGVSVTGAYDLLVH